MDLVAHGGGATRRRGNADSDVGHVAVGDRIALAKEDNVCAQTCSIFILQP